MALGLSVAALCVAASAGPASAAPIAYEFTLIADTAGSFSGFGREVSINNAGTVAFRAGLDKGGTGIFTGAGGATTTIVTSASPAFSSFGTPVVNDAGAVAFFAGLAAGGRGIFRVAGGATTTIADSNGAFNTSFGFTPSINNSGVVAFSAGLDAGGRGIFTGSGGATTTIVTVNGPLILGPLLSNPAINDAGTVAYWARLGTAGSFTFGIFAGDGGPLTAIATSGSEFAFFGNVPAINDDGTVAFQATFGSARGLFTGDGGPTTKIADSAGPLNIALADQTVAINNLGDVAFLVGLDTGGEAIFTGPDIDDKVIGYGDALFGSTIGHPLFPFLTLDNIEFFRDGFNDSGQIAFWARLADGREVIARATPLGLVSVPEPGTATIVAAGLALLLFPGCRTRRGSNWGELRFRVKQ